MTQWAPQIGLVMFVAMIVLMALRVPIAAAMFIPGLVGYALMSDTATVLNFLKGSAVARLTVYELSVIPLFLLMGQFATQGGLSRDLFKAAAALVGHVRGGLAMASVLSAGAFGAVFVGERGWLTSLSTGGRIEGGGVATRTGSWAMWRQACR